MKYLIISVIVAYLGLLLGWINNQGIFKNYYYLNQFFISLELLVVKYYWHFIWLTLIIGVLYLQIDVIDAQGKEEKVKISSNISYHTYWPSTNLDPVAFPIMIGTAFKLGHEIAKKCPTVAGKVAVIGFSLGGVTLAKVITDKYKPPVKNEELNPMVLIDLKNELIANNELISDVYMLNTVLLVGLGLLLNIYLVGLLKGKEIELSKYLPFIKGGSRLESWIKWYINKMVKIGPGLYILVWVTVLKLALAIKYIIIVKMLSG